MEWKEAGSCHDSCQPAAAVVFSSLPWQLPAVFVDADAALSLDCLGLKLSRDIYLSYPTRSQQTNPPKKFTNSQSQSPARARPGSSEFLFKCWRWKRRNFFCHAASPSIRFRSGTPPSHLAQNIKKATIASPLEHSIPPILFFYISFHFIAISFFFPLNNLIILITRVVNFTSPHPTTTWL